MRKYFTSGLVILLPLVLTLMIVNLLVNFFTRPFLPQMEDFLVKLIEFPQPLFFFHQSILLTLASKIVILAILGGLIVLIGLFGELFVVNTFSVWAILSSPISR